MLAFCPGSAGGKGAAAQARDRRHRGGQTVRSGHALPSSSGSSGPSASRKVTTPIERQRDEIGRAIDGWRVGSAFGDRAFYHGNYLLRAAAALAGIYGNDAVEAMYP